MAKTEGLCHKKQELIKILKGFMKEEWLYPFGFGQEWG